LLTPKVVFHDECCTFEVASVVGPDVQCAIKYGIRTLI
jgi:hypothetical protein